MAALQQADSFAPCVLLMDEVEKLFEIIIELPRLAHKEIEIDSHRTKLIAADLRISPKPSRGLAV
jgi:hypothetical protein